MFRESVELSPNTDVGEVLTRLEKRLDQAGIRGLAADLAVQSVGSVARVLCDQGRLLSPGSQMNVVRDVEGPGYAVRLNFRSKPRRGFIATILGR